MSSHHICLLAPGHLASSPRLVKEADALAEAGYSVHVISGTYHPPFAPHDRLILQSAQWSHTAVPYRPGVANLPGRLLRELARRHIRILGKASLPTCIRALHTATPLLRKAARRRTADLYIGHCIAALPAAAAAARHQGALLGFDAEDFHSAETLDRDPAELYAVKRVEAAFYPQAAHFTASSPLIAQACEKSYGVRRPVTVLNVFPLRQSPETPLRPPSAAPRLYWFSQFIGPDRGIEALLAVLGRLRTTCELHLQGFAPEGTEQRLRALAAERHFRGKLLFLPIIPAAELPQRAASYDLGLSLESGPPLNKDLCLGNKIFTYLLGGVPVALTPTTAQVQLARELGDAAIVLDLTNSDAAARVLDSWLLDLPRREQARHAAWHSAHTRYNWDTEKAALLASVAAVLANRRPSHE